MNTSVYLRASSPAEIRRQERTFARLRRTHAAFFSFLKETAAPPRGAKVLELACGCGMLADLARRELAAEAEGWDLNPAYIAHAARAYPRTAFAVRDMLAGPAAPARDLLLFREALMEFPSPAAALRRCLRLLRRGGWAAALEPDYGATVIHPEVPGWARFVERYAAFCAASGGEDFFAGRKLLGAFRAAGLRRLAVRPLVETHTALDGAALKEFLEAEIMSIEADAGLLTARRVFSRAGLDGVLRGLRRAAASRAAYVQTTMVAICGRK